MNLNKKIFQWLTLILLSLIWGTSFILIKKGLKGLTSEQLAAFRMTFAYLLFLPIALKRLKKINKQNWFYLVAVGFVGNFFPAFLFAFAQQKIPSAIAGMLNSTTTLFTWIFGIFIYKTKTSFKQILGIIIGFIGAIGLMAKDFSQFLQGWNLYAVLILTAAALYGLNTNIVKNNLKNLDGISISSLSFFTIGPFAIMSLILSVKYQQFAYNQYFTNSISAVFVLAFLSSFTAIIIFNKLIKYTSAVFAASVTYLIPFFAIFWGLIDGEKISLIQIISIFIVILGVYLANSQAENNA